MFDRRHSIVAICLTLAILPALWMAAATVRADVLELANGGVIRGEWLNRHEPQPQSYVMRGTSGGEIRVPAASIKQVIRQKPLELEYEALAPKYADTVEDQWKLADWCRRHQLTGQRDVHLRRILELDERFAPAWYALGYSQLGGRWQRTAETNRERGYEYHRGRWRLAQEVELVDQQVKLKAAQDEWRKRINQLRNSLDSPGRAVKVYAELREIRDPHAIPALVAAYSKDRRPAFRRMIVQTIGQIDGAASSLALFNVALSDVDAEIFHDCVDRLEARRPDDLVDSLVKALSSGYNPVVNRAAYMLGRLGDRSAIGPLIDVLATRHWIPLGHPGGSASYSATFGRADQANDSPIGAGLSKSEPQWVQVWLHNQDVLDALVKLSGGANFSYQTQAWRVWHAAEKSRPTPPVGSRRDTTTSK